jgi:poly(glycerol-phosphate) alpha-glucosyltransferase
MLSASVSRNGAGVFESVRNLSIELQRLDVDLQVFGLRDEHTEVDRATWDGVHINAFRTRGPNAVGYAPGLLEALRSADLDIVHGHGMWMYQSRDILKWAKSKGRPHLVTPHGMLDPWALRNSKWKKRIAAVLYERARMKSAYCIHALCNPEVDAIRRYGLTNPICVIPNGVHIPNLSPDDHARTSEPKTLLYLGRMHPKKGLEQLIYAWDKLLRMRKPDWRLAIAGWDQGGYAARLRALSRALDLDDSIVFPGPQFGEDKHHLLANAHAFVLPSLSEGLPMTVLEAWAYGLPVVMTPECNLSHGFDKGAAIRVGSDPQAIAKGLLELTAMSDTERTCMGRAGQSIVRSQYSWSSVTTTMRSVYLWLLGAGSPPNAVRVR